MGKDFHDKTATRYGKTTNFFEGWVCLSKELWNRLIEPVQYPNFVLYFIVIIIGIGGIGPWINLIKGDSIPEFYYSIATFSLALASASFADVVLFKNIDTSIVQNDKHEIVAFPYTCIFITTASSSIISLVICGFFPNFITIGARFSAVSLFFGVFLWWQVNSRNPQLSRSNWEAESPANALGDTAKINAGEDTEYKIN